MERDKLGRFIKKYNGGNLITFNNVQSLLPLDGSFITINGVKYQIRKGANAKYTELSSPPNFNLWLIDNNLVTPLNYDSDNNILIFGDKQYDVDHTAQGDYAHIYNLEKPQYDEWLLLNKNDYLSDISLPTYYTKNKYLNLQDNDLVKINGKKYRVLSGMVDELKNKAINPNFNFETWALGEGSSYFSEIDPGLDERFSLKNHLAESLNKPIDKEKLANFLDVAKMGIGIATNNKVAERALEAEKPFLEDISESHRSIYGDYRAQMLGQQTAAQLRNMASKPLTSDGALQQQMMMEALIKGQDYINQGNAQDEALIRQTKETAWEQEKENLQQRQAVAMQNRQAMLLTEANKAQIENIRDQGNFSQIIEPFISTQEQRLRNKAAQQEAAHNQLMEKYLKTDVFNNYRFSGENAEKYNNLKTLFLNEGTTGVQSAIAEGTYTNEDWNHVYSILTNELLKKQAEFYGTSITSMYPTTKQYGYFSDDSSVFKKGGTIYKAKLTKRTRDNDRGAKSIEASKKIAARFLEKALDSLHNYKEVLLIAKPSKKRKYQSGGGLPLVGYTPIFATSETSSPRQTLEKEESEGEDLTTKDILELLKDMEGLPIDRKLIVQDLQNFTIANLMDPLGIDSSSNIASRYIRLISQIKEASFHKNEYETAFNLLKSNGGLNEAAITSEGMLIGTNSEGNFEYFSPEEVGKGEHSKQGYLLLTNSNLLYLRANSPDAAFNHKLITIAQNGISIDTINKLINTAINTIGTSSDSKEGYVKTQEGLLMLGLEEFYKAVKNSDGNFDGTINDLYKYKLLNKSQAEQAKKAIEYIYLTMPANAKSLLKIKSDGTEKGALKLIETLISSRVNPEVLFDIDLVGGSSKKSEKTESEKDDTDLKTSLPLNVQKGIGGVETRIILDRGDGIQMSVKGTLYNLIKTPEGEPVQNTSLAQMLSSSGLQNIVKDMRSIQFGDQRISPEALYNITYNNTGVVRANLPIKSDGSVNLDLLEAYEKAENDIELSGDKSPENIKKIYELYKLTSLLNADGTYNRSKFAPFMITEGYTTDALSGVSNSDFVKEFNGDEKAAILLIQNSLAIGSGKNTLKPELDKFQWYNPADWFGWTDTIYKGTIYIPIDNNVNSAVYGANQNLDYNEALIQEEKYLNFEKMSNLRSTSADLLNI